MSLSKGWAWCGSASEFLEKRREALLREESKNCFAFAAVASAQNGAGPGASAGQALFRYIVFLQDGLASAHALQVNKRLTIPR